MLSIFKICVMFCRSEATTPPACMQILKLPSQNLMCFFIFSVAAGIFADDNSSSCVCSFCQSQMVCCSGKYGNEEHYAVGRYKLFQFCKLVKSVAKCNLGQVTCRLELIKVILSGVFGRFLGGLRCFVFQQCKDM